MAILLEHQNILFIGVPGTASTSIGTSLQALPGAKWLAPKHTTVDTLLSENILTRESLNRLTTICVVRNPFDLIHAEWHRSSTRWILEMEDMNSVGSWPAEKRQQIQMSAELDFSTFIKTYYGIFFVERKGLSIFKQYTKSASFIFRYENLSELVSWFKEKQGILLSLEVSNKTAGRIDYRNDYDSIARDVVAAVFDEDIKGHGYEF
jgi:hypothetical protein